MAPKPDRLRFVLGMVLTIAVIILTITTYAALPDPETPIPPSETIYRPQHWNVY